MGVAEIRILTTCVLGLGFSYKGFQAGLEREPHLIGCDSGSSDFGPYYLGSGLLQKPPSALEGELTTLISGALKVGAPFVTGSVGGAGGAPHLRETGLTVRRVAEAAGLDFRLAEISAVVTPEFLRRKLKAGDLQPLGPAPEVTPETLDRLAAAVGQMGARPYMRALDMGAQVVLAGRTTDPSIFVGAPLRAGLPAGPAWHAAKSSDKGYLATTRPQDGSPILARIREDHFTIEPTREGSRCTTATVAGMIVYENSHPYRVEQPGGAIDTEGAVYTQMDERTVHVTGSRFIPSDVLTIKIEGAELVGHRAIVIAGLRDPRIIANLDAFLAEFRHNMSRIARSAGVDEDQYVLQFRTYGRDAVMGANEPLRASPSHEIGLIIDLVGKTLEITQRLAVRLGPAGNRLGMSESSVGGGNFAYPFSPSTLQLGPVYAWSVWHLAQIDEQEEEEIFPLEMAAIGGRRR